MRTRMLFLASVLAFGGCRCRSTYDDATTKACKHEAAADASTPSEDVRGLCVACCHRHGLDDVEPGPCECGKIGWDALLK